MNLQVTDVEVEVLRFLAGKHHEYDPFPFDDIPAVKDVQRFERLQMRERLCKQGLCEEETLDADRITELGLQYLQDRDNPPPRDYPSEWNQWLRSHPWSVLVIAVVVLLPLVVWILDLFVDD